MPPRVAIAGTGLIGASVGLGLGDAGWEVVGWDPDPVVLEAARRRGAMAASAAGIEGLLGVAPDVLLLAAPQPAVVAALRGLRTDVLVTDVAGLKRPVLAAAGHLPRFVGGHPMAGREVSGPEAASGALFRGAAWVLTTDGASEADLAAVERLVTDLGAVPVRMDAATHDVAVARISHLPQLLAGALLRLAAVDGTSLTLVAGSFRDLTRVAASDPGGWVDLLVGNVDAVEDAVEQLVTELRAAVGDLRRADREAVRSRLEEARLVRARLAPPVVPVRVALADRPGELAKVGHALETSGVDVRDLQLRHAPHGGGGVLTISVRPGEAGALRRALTEEGLLLVEASR